MFLAINLKKSFNLVIIIQALLRFEGRRHSVKCPEKKNHRDSLASFFNHPIGIMFSDLGY